jgi:hypothetical protein
LFSHRLSPPATSPVMSSFHQPFKYRISQTPNVGSSADPPTSLSTPPSPRRRRPQNLQLHAASGEHIPPADRYMLSKGRNGTASIKSSPTSARHSQSIPPSALKNVAYRFPFQASRALRNLSATEATSTYLASLRGRPTSRCGGPSRTHSPTFPYNEYAPLPDLPPTYSGIEASDRAEEVYALSASQHPLATDSLTTCGRCLTPLRWEGTLPSRCQEPKCRAVNVGSDWAANERFRQTELSRHQQANIQEVKNYLGEPIKYDKLLRWRREGARRDQDPVDWRRFIYCDVSEPGNDEGDCNSGEYLPSAPRLSSCSQSRDRTPCLGQNDAMHYRSIAQAARSDPQFTAAGVDAETHTTTFGAEEAVKTASNDLPLDISESPFDIPNDLMNDMITRLSDFAYIPPQFRHHPRSPQQQQRKQEQAKPQDTVNPTDVSPNDASFPFNSSHQHPFNRNTSALDFNNKTHDNNKVNPPENPLLYPSPSSPSTSPSTTTSSSTRTPSPALFTATAAVAAAAAAARGPLPHNIKPPELDLAFAPDGRARLIPSVNTTSATATTTTTTTATGIPTTANVTPPTPSTSNTWNPSQDRDPHHHGTGRAEDEALRLFSKRRRNRTERRQPRAATRHTPTPTPTTANANTGTSVNLNQRNRIIRPHRQRRHHRGGAAAAAATAAPNPTTGTTSLTDTPRKGAGTGTDAGTNKDRHRDQHSSIFDDTDTDTDDHYMKSPFSASGSASAFEGDNDDSGDFVP